MKICISKYRQTTLDLTKKFERFHSFIEYYQMVKRSEEVGVYRFDQPFESLIRADLRHCHKVFSLITPSFFELSNSKSPTLLCRIIFPTDIDWTTIKSRPNISASTMLHKNILVSCKNCIAGHRASHCEHLDRPLLPSRIKVEEVEPAARLS
jgi:hypothetical protein